MSEQNHIESFDNLFKQTFEGAKTPVPQGVWEGIAASTTGASTAATGILAKLLGFKGAAIIGTVAVITGGYFAIDALTTSNNLPVIQNVQDFIPNSDVESTLPTIIIDSVERTTSNTQANKTKTEIISDAGYLQQQATSPQTAKTLISPVQEFKKIKHDRAVDVKPAFIPHLSLVVSPDKACVNQTVHLQLMSNGNLSETRWFLDNKVIEVQRDRAELMFTQKGLHTVKVIGKTHEGITIETSKIIEISGANASFNFRVEDQAVILNAEAGGVSHHWYVNHVKQYNSSASIEIPTTDLKTMEVLHIANNLRGCADSVIKLIPLTSCERDATVYDGFSPHLQDGINDEWIIELPVVETYYVVVFSSDGNIVFETINQGISWNGKRLNQGDLLPIGTYTYQLVYECGGQKKTRSGKISLQ